MVTEGVDGTRLRGAGSRCEWQDPQLLHPDPVGWAGSDPPPVSTEAAAFPGIRDAIPAWPVGPLLSLFAIGFRVMGAAARALKPRLVGISGRLHMVADRAPDLHPCNIATLADGKGKLGSFRTCWDVQGRPAAAIVVRGTEHGESAFLLRRTPPDRLIREEDDGTKSASVRNCFGSEMLTGLRRPSTSQVCVCHTDQLAKMALCTPASSW